MDANNLPDAFLRKMDPIDRAKLGDAGKLMAERRAELDASMEKSLHNMLIQYLNLHNIFYIHSNMAKRSTATKGTPDFLFAIDGQACALECKTADGELSEDQEKAITAMRKNGWAIEVCTSIQQAIGFIQRFQSQ
jgi:hypothetical protein